MTDETPPAPHEDHPRHTPTAHTQRHPVRGVLAGIAVLLVVAIPAAWTTFFAWSSFTGCFITCRATPEPRVGMLYTLITVFLITLPIATGLIASRSRPPRVWTWFAAVAVALIVAGLFSQLVV